MQLHVRLVEVLGLEVIERVLAAGDDLARQRGAHAVSGLEHGGLDLATRQPRARSAPWGRASTAPAIAASSSARSSTREIPIDDPARAGFTNTGNPSASISRARERGDVAGDAAPPRRSPASPAASKAARMYSLSMPIADASTPAPT